MPMGTLAALGVTGSVMLCQDVDLRVGADPNASKCPQVLWQRLVSMVLSYCVRMLI